MLGAHVLTGLNQVLGQINQVLVGTGGALICVDVLHGAGTFKVMAWVGQGAKQVPQPLQRDASNVGQEMPPRVGVKRMAAVSQISPHTRHSTFFRARHAGLMSARQSQGG